MKRLLKLSLTLAGLMSVAATATASAATIHTARISPAVVRTTTTYHRAAGVRIPESDGYNYCRLWGLGSEVLGWVCINAESNGYNAQYINTGTASHYVDFNLVTAAGVHYGDQGAFTSAPGSTHTYFFAVGNLGCSRVYLYARTEGWNIYSPSDSAAGFCAA